MYLKFYFDAILWEKLYNIDKEIANFFHGSPCQENDCPGKLNWANYLRKPRGVIDSVESWLMLKFSLCCSQQGCRTRSTPPSVRFLGRRVYIALFIMLMLLPEDDADVAKVQEKIITLPPKSFDKSTFRRWFTWWNTTIPRSPIWKKMVGTLPANVDNQFLPTFIMKEFIEKHVDIEKSVTAMLEFISPISVPHNYPPSDYSILWNDNLTQKMKLYKIGNLPYIKRSD